MSDTKQSTEDLAILEQLNLDYNNADQASDAERFSELLAEDQKRAGTWVCVSACAIAPGS